MDKLAQLQKKYSFSWRDTIKTENVNYIKDCIDKISHIDNGDTDEIYSITDTIYKNHDRIKSLYFEAVQQGMIDNLKELVRRLQNNG